MSAILWASSRSRPLQSLGSNATLPPYTAYVTHLAEYAALSLALYFGLSTIHRLHRRILWAFSLAVIYGITDELHQAFVPGRSSDPLDVAIDGMGSAAALLLLWLVIALLRRVREPVNRRPV